MADRTGIRYGSLTAIKLAGYCKGDSKVWVCKCDCGVTVEVSGRSLHSGGTKTCSYHRREETNLIHGYTKGGKKGPEYRAWDAIKQRVNNPNNKDYRNYGGRGITLASEWLKDFQAFYNYVGPRPSFEHSLDRINVNGNYEPGNVRWATAKEQNLNKRQKVFLENIEKPWLDGFMTAFKVISKVYYGTR